jgi:putative ABC transport system permease protein
MSDIWLKVLAGAGFAAVAVGLSLRYRLGHAREIALAAVRAIVQLAAVGAAIALVFEFPTLALAFVAVMVTRG